MQQSLIDVNAHSSANVQMTWLSAGTAHQFSNGWNGVPIFHYSVFTPSQATRDSSGLWTVTLPERRLSSTLGISPDRSAPHIEIGDDRSLSITPSRHGPDG